MSNFTIRTDNENSVFANMRGHHVALRVADFAIAKDFYVGKLNFRMVHEWPYAAEEMAYLAPPNGNTFMVELIAAGDSLPEPAPVYTDLGDTLRHAGLHHFCMTVTDNQVTIAAGAGEGPCDLLSVVDEMLSANGGAAE
ncbi:VOC family protein [Sulfitobacter sp. PR48]|uniref:VOC family protein n=1 Tax=Sulfitobacter sp. PR48 TaxID=3028383 RepID=UPI00237C408E|nr:VOC family protein [Sulfitobacter sp. PR48]MDD9723613.1 VOC family protein [Sulfitobacter sp. PR48]